MLNIECLMIEIPAGSTKLAGTTKEKILNLFVYNLILKFYI